MKLFFKIFPVLLLAGCGAAGTTNTDSIPVYKTAVPPNAASTVPVTQFNLAAAYTAMIKSSSAQKYSVSGLCTGTLTEYRTIAIPYAAGAAVSIPTTSLLSFVTPTPGDPPLLVSVAPQWTATLQMVPAFTGCPVAASVVGITFTLSFNGTSAEPRFPIGYSNGAGIYTGILSNGASTPAGASFPSIVIVGSNNLLASYATSSDFLGLVRPANTYPLSVLGYFVEAESVNTVLVRFVQKFFDLTRAVNSKTVTTYSEIMTQQTTYRLDAQNKLTPLNIVYTFSEEANVFKTKNASLTLTAIQ